MINCVNAFKNSFKDFGTNVVAGNYAKTWTNPLNTTKTSAAVAIGILRVFFFPAEIFTAAATLWNKYKASKVADLPQVQALQPKTEGVGHEKKENTTKVFSHLSLGENSRFSAETLESLSKLEKGEILTGEDNKHYSVKEKFETKYISTPANKTNFTESLKGANFFVYRTLEDGRTEKTSFRLKYETEVETKRTEKAKV